MKTSYEWIRDIHEKADKRLADQKKRKKIITSISSLTMCLALVLCSVFAVPSLIENNGISTAVPENSGTNQTLDNTHNNSANDSAHSDESIIPHPSSDMNLGVSSVDNTSSPSINNPPISPIEEPNNDNDIKRLFAPNKIITQISAAPKYHDPKEHYKDFWTEAKINKYLGVNLTTLSSMPSDLTYVQKNDFKILFHNNGEIIEDYQSFVYNGNNSRKVEVLVSKISNPYDCIYKLETESKTPVGNTEVLFGIQSNGKDSSKYDFYYADFMSGGLYYRVKADNLTPIEFYKIVEEISTAK